MISPKQKLLRPQTAAAVLLVACVLGLNAGTLGQDQTAAIAKDAIVARKTAMDTLSDKMDVIEAAIAVGTKLNLDEGHANADIISVLLMAFPHLFPPSTNEWKPNVDRDPATDTYASPDIWTKFADFYKQATTASKAAFDASRADDEAAFKAAIAQLRAGCNACHAAYLKMD
jgi:cytochrome c556